MQRRWFQLIAAGILALGAASEGFAQPGCGGFGFGRRSFAFGSNRVLGGGWYGAGFGWGAGWGCRPCFGWRPACGGWPVNSWWGPGWGGLGYGWGWPGCGYGGWYGGVRYSGVESVFLSVPFGGGASFFSGSVVPYPVPVWTPYAVPVPFWLGAAPARSPRARFAASAPPSVRALPAEPTRAVAAIASPSRTVPATSMVARRRAARLVAAGDRALAASAGGRVGMKAAEASYRRAVAAVADDPDVLIRHAVVLTLQGRNVEAAAACERAIALDGRLADRPADRRPGELPPVVARGRRILADLAGHTEVADAAARASIAALEARWIDGAAAPVVALAARGPSGR